MVPFFFFQILWKVITTVNVIKSLLPVFFRKNMYAGGEPPINVDMPDDEGHGEGGGHTVGDELKKTGRYL